jgi:hypothetical protein
MLLVEPNIFMGCPTYLVFDLQWAPGTGKIWGVISYDSNFRASRVFNKDSGCIETMCNAVFDETNGYQVEQYDLDDLDDEEAPCDALRTMTTGDVRP